MKCLRATFGKNAVLGASFDLDAEVAQAYADFPQLKRDTYFIDAVSRRVIHPDGKNILRRIKESPDLMREVREMGRKAASLYVPKDMHDAPFNLVILNFTPGNYNALYPHGYSETQKRRRVFTHELGHAVTMRIRNAAAEYAVRPMLHETEAEVFSFLQMFRERGGRRMKGEEEVALRAANFVFGHDAERYFPAPAMEEVLALALKDKFNLAALSPRRMVDMTRKVALERTPGMVVMADLRQLRSCGEKKSLPALAKTVLSSPSPDVRKWGAAALRYVMGPGLNDGFVPPSAALRFKKHNWPRVRRELEGREKQILRSSVRPA